MNDDPTWTYEARVTTPNGLTIRTSIALPQSHAGPDSLELLEVAQMSAARMANMVKNISRSPRQAAIYCAKPLSRNPGLNCVLHPGHAGTCSDEPNVEVPF